MSYVTPAVPDYGYDYGYSGGSALAAFGILIALFYLLIIAYGVTNYVLQSLALYRMAKNRNLKYPGLAWVPVANSWIIGSVVDHHSRIGGIDRQWRKTLLTLSIISAAGVFLYFILAFAASFSMVFGATSAAGLIVILVPVLIIYALSVTANSLCTIICTYKIFEELTPAKAVKYILLTILVPLGGPICMLIASKSMIGVPVYYPPYYPPQPVAPQPAAPAESEEETAGPAAPAEDDAAPVE